MRTVHVAGTRSFAAEVVEFARDAGLEVAALLEPADAERIGTTIHGLPVRALDDAPAADRAVIVGTGDVERRDVVARLERAGWEVVGLVHPRAHLASTARLGRGTLVAPGVVVGAEAVLGDHVVLGRGSLVGHHTEIGAWSTLGPGANVAGNVRVGEGVFLAMACAVRDHVTVGAGASVAMGAVVTTSVPAGVAVRGVPARRSP